MIPGRPWLLALTAIGFVVVATLLAAIRPFVADHRTSTRKPTNTERKRLAGGIDGDRRVRLRITERSPDAASPRARALGILPSYQYVFIVERLLASLSTAAGRAVVAHEIGHHREWHPLVRVVLPAVALVGWPLAIVSDVSHALGGGVVVLVPYVLFVCYIERQTEYRADTYAAKKVGYSPMITALEYLEETNPDQQRSRVAGLLATRPSLAERITDLEGRSGDDKEEEAEKKEKGEKESKENDDGFREL